MELVHPSLEGIMTPEVHDQEIRQHPVLIDSSKQFEFLWGDFFYQAPL